MPNALDIALIHAVANNDSDKVRELLEQGADPNTTIDDALLTPLHFAAQNNAIEIALLLFTAGADVNRTTEDGETPMNIAKEFEHKEMITLLNKLRHQHSS